MTLSKVFMLPSDTLFFIGCFFLSIILVISLLLIRKSKKNNKVYVCDNKIVRFTSDIIKLLFYSNQIGKLTYVEVYKTPYCTVNNCDIEMNSKFSYDLIKLLIDGTQKHLVIKCDNNGTVKYVGCYKSSFSDVWDENVLKIGICEKSKTFSIVHNGKIIESLSPASSINIVRNALM
jgi:hypothetical protein